MTPDPNYRRGKLRKMEIFRLLEMAILRRKCICII